MAWILLILAGLCEVAWALGLKFSQGFSKPIETIVTIGFMVLSLYFLALATRQIPLSISYTIWVGIGAIGAVIGGIFLFGEKVNIQQMIFFGMILIGIIGIKITAA